MSVLAAAWTLVFAQMGMVAAAANAEGLTGLGEVHARLLVVKGLDEDVALAFCSATIAKAFFRFSADFNGC